MGSGGRTDIARLTAYDLAMATRLRALVAILMVIAAGCSGGGDESASPAEEIVAIEGLPDAPDEPVGALAVGPPVGLDRGDQRFDRRSVVWPFTPIAIDQGAFRVDDEVAAQLQRVLGCSLRPLKPVLPIDLDVATRHAPPPDPKHGASADPEGLVSRPIRVGQDRERKALTLQVGLQVVGVAEGNEGNIGVGAKGI